MSDSDASDQPLVSIGLPTYNRVTALERAIDSVLAQQYRNIELVISDNGSTDGTEALCRRAVAGDRRIRYLRQPTNRGASFNFRHVLAESQGALFMWLGDDDWLDPNYVGRCAAVLVASPEHSMACGRDRYYRSGVFDKEGAKVDVEEASGSERVVSYYRQVTMNGTFYGVMRKDLISRVPVPDQLGGDWMMIAAMAFMGKVKTLDDTFINRSLGGGSADWARLAALFNLTKVEEENPHLTIAAGVFSDLAWRSPIYASLGLARRLALATRASHVVTRRQYSRRHTIAMAYRLCEVLRARIS